MTDTVLRVKSLFHTQDTALGDWECQEPVYIKRLPAPHAQAQKKRGRIRMHGGVCAMVFEPRGPVELNQRLAKSDFQGHFQWLKKW